MTVPDPTNPYPLPDHKPLLRVPAAHHYLREGQCRRLHLLDASKDTGSFEDERVLYGFGSERLLIGKFCAIVAGARFVMAAANHLSSDPSTFPFTIFPGRWQNDTLETFQAHTISKGDRVVGNDVWFGRDVTMMPGVTIGNGAIIATAAVVTRDVKPYTIVGRNPAQLIKQRYSEADVRLLQRAAWWDWPIEIISAHTATLIAGSPRGYLICASR